MRRGCWIPIACGLLLAACRTPEVWPALAPGDPRPGVLLAGWSERVGARQGLRARAWLAVDAEDSTGREIRVRTRQRLLIARPGRMRVEIQGLFGTTLAVLATDGEEYALLEAETRAYESGPVHDTLLWDVARLHLTPEQVVGVLLGAPELGADRRVHAAFALPAGSVRIAIAEGNGAVGRVADFDSQGRLQRIEVMDADGGTLYTAAYEAYADLGGSPVAHVVTIEAPETVARIVLREIELDPAVDDGVFRIDPPADADAAERPSYAVD